MGEKTATATVLVTRLFLSTQPLSPVAMYLTTLTVTIAMGTTSLAILKCLTVKITIAILLFTKLQNGVTKMRQRH